MPINDIKDQNAANPLSVASDVHGDRGGHRHEVGAGAGQIKDYKQARLLARDGFGWEDICAELKSIPRDHARMIVLGRGAIERKK